MPGIVWTVEIQLYYEAMWGKERPPPLNCTTSTLNGGTMYMVRSERFLLRASSADSANVETLRGLFKRWMSSTMILESSGKLDRIYKEIEGKLGHFSDGLRQAAGDVALGEL